MVCHQAKMPSSFSQCIVTAVCLFAGTMLWAQGDAPQENLLPEPAADGADAQAAPDAPTEGGASGAQASVPRLCAVVDANGTLIRGSGVTSVRRVAGSAGRYEVVFNTDVNTGAFAASIGSPEDELSSVFGEIRVSRRSNNTKGVLVRTADSTGTPADRGFHLIVSLATSAPPTTQPPNPTRRIVNVQVHRHRSVALTDDDARRILAEMGTVLQRADQSNDVATAVEFRLNGSVAVLPANIAGVVQTAEQMDAVFSLPGIKVLRGIDWCGGPGGSIIGCAPVGSPRVNEAVVRFTTADLQEGILWAHEYGHNAGRSHRTDDVNAIMFPSIGGTHRVVNNAESLAYLSGPQAATTGHLEALVAPHEDGEQPAAPLPDIKTFVRQHYVEGVPAELASRYKEEDALELLKMLENRSEVEEFLPEIVTTLCYIGSKKAIQPLMKFAKSDAVTPQEWRAKKAALMHLGDLVNKANDGGEEVLGMLSEIANAPEPAINLAKPRRLEAARTASEGVEPPSAEELASELAVAATWGLALSGKPQAAESIRKLQAAESRAFDAVKKTAVQAEKTNETIRKVGPAKYRSHQLERKANP